MEDAPTVDFLNIGIGLFLLFFGRKLFWLFVGGVGFVVGVMLANDFLASQSDNVVLSVGLVLGLVGMGATLFLKKIALRTAGFFAGMFIAGMVVNFFEINHGHFLWVYLGLGGVIGLLLVLAVFEWSILLLSSLTGALLITEVVPVGRKFIPVVFGVVALVGIFVQFQMMPGKKRKAGKAETLSGE